MTVSRITNPEAQNDKKKARITALDKSIQERLNDKAHVIVERGKGDPKFWIEHPFDHNPDFRMISAMVSPMRRSQRLMQSSK